MNFSRIVWTTFHCRGITSSVSVTSSQSLASRAPHEGQEQGAGTTTRSRGRCAGKGARTGLRYSNMNPRVDPLGNRGGSTDDGTAIFVTPDRMIDIYAECV